MVGAFVVPTLSACTHEAPQPRSSPPSPARAPQAPPHIPATPPENPAGATYASAAGTLTVCARAGDCWTRRFRPPARDAWDEVYGGVPAYTVPGTRKVLVADVSEGQKTATLWVHAYESSASAAPAPALAPVITTTCSCTSRRLALFPIDFGRR